MTEKSKGHGGASGTEFVYVVEARSTYHTPQEANGMVLDNRWQRVSFADGHGFGVKNTLFFREAHHHGFVNYEAALTLLHWFLANAGYCIEARLVKIKLTYSWNTEEVGVSDGVSMFHAERDSQFKPRLVDESVTGR